MSEISPQEQDLVKRIVKSVYDQLGQDAAPDLVKKIVAASLKEITKGQTPANSVGQNPDITIPMGSSRIIITVFGQNRTGVVAMVSDCLAKNNCNILDISQKILQADYPMP